VGALNLTVSFCQVILLSIFTLGKKFKDNYVPRNTFVLKLSLTSYSAFKRFDVDYYIADYITKNFSRSWGTYTGIMFDISYFDNGMFHKIPRPSIRGVENLKRLVNDSHNFLVSYNRTSYEKAILQHDHKIERSLVTRKLREQIIVRDNAICQHCHKKLHTSSEIAIDHIVPVSLGGLTISENLQVLCKACNLHKSNNYVG
jgi:hypothetical protein